MKKNKNRRNRKATRLVDNDFEYPDELAKNIGRISLHFQRLEYVLYEFLGFLLGDTKKAKDEISGYNFDRKVTLLDLLLHGEIQRRNHNQNLTETYTGVYSALRNIQKQRNNIIHSSFTITYHDRNFDVKYNIKDVAKKGTRSIKKLQSNELENLVNLIKDTVKSLSAFYYMFRALRGSNYVRSFHSNFPSI